MKQRLTSVVTQGGTTDVNLCFINYEMIKAHMIKTNWWRSLNQKRFYEMNAYQLPYLSLFRVCIILRCVRFFLIFLLIINRESHGVVLVSTNEKRLQNQVYRQIKSKLVDIFGSGKSSPFERVDFSLYHFLSSFSKSR